MVETKRRENIFNLLSRYRDDNIKIKRDVIEDYSSQRDENLIIEDSKIFETIETLMDPNKYLVFSQKAKKVVEDNYNQARIKFAL